MSNSISQESADEKDSPTPSKDEVNRRKLFDFRENYLKIENFNMGYQSKNSDQGSIQQRVQLMSKRPSIEDQSLDVSRK